MIFFADILSVPDFDSEFLADDGFYKDGYFEEDGTEYDRYGNPL